MRKRFILSVVLVVAGALSACGNDDTETTQANAPAAEAAPEQPASDIDAAVQKVVGVLNELGIEHTDPVRAAVGGSGAKARFDITINRFDAGINVFSNAETLAAWQELSDSFGGVHVAFDNTAISLNSSEGITNSIEIAPLIAEAIGGVARNI